MGLEAGAARLLAQMAKQRCTEGQREFPQTPADRGSTARGKDRTAAPRFQPEAPMKTPEQIDEDMRQRGYPARHRAQLTAGLRGPALEKAKELLPRIMAGNALLFLVGLHGPGKTQIATWLGAERAKAGNGLGYYRKTADLITEIKATWSGSGEENTLKRYQTTPFLVLDEFHEKGCSDWESRTLINILDHRYDNMLATILIANLSEAQVRAEINPSILSRAEETGGLVLCNWPSYRSAH